MKNRTISWCEGKIISVLTRQREITTYLAMSAQVLRNVRSIDEQHNLDIAIENLLSRKIIQKTKDRDGYTVFSLAA